MTSSRVYRRPRPDHRTMTIIMMPSEFVEMARAIGARATTSE